MFSAGSPLGERGLGVDVPKTFQQLTVGSPHRSEPRLPGFFLTPTILQKVKSDVRFPTTALTSPESIEPRASFRLTGKRGVGLVTKHLTYGEDTTSQGLFQAYTKQYYESWVAFARDSGHGGDVQPVLVSGVDLTRDYAMLVYSIPDEDAPLIPMPHADLMPIADPSSPWAKWSAPDFVHTNIGPLRQNLLPSQQSTPAEYDQCIFIRYYSMRSGPFRLFPKVIRT